MNTESRNKSYIKQILTIVSSIALLSTISAARTAEKAQPDLKLNGVDCISIRTIRDYTPLSRDSLLIHTSGKRSYYVRLQTPQFGKQFSFQLATRSRDDSLCPYGGDTLILDSFGHEETRIQSISRLSKSQVEQVLIHYGKIEPADKPDPAPPELKGAEVEELG